MTNTTMTVEDRYAAEQAQTEHDHHVPTAGAMTNHILSNLHISIVKFHQVLWSVKGPLALSIRTLSPDYPRCPDRWWRLLVAQPQRLIHC